MPGGRTRRAPRKVIERSRSPELPIRNVPTTPPAWSALLPVLLACCASVGVARPSVGDAGRGDAADNAAIGEAGLPSGDGGQGAYAIADAVAARDDASRNDASTESTEGGPPPPSSLGQLDTLVFGDVASESTHALKTAFSSVQAAVAPIPSEPSTGPASDLQPGAFGLGVRRLLPRAPNPDYYGGAATFTMRVDPVKQNYFTVKTWGSDASTSWLVLNVNGFEVGWRHQYLATDEMIFMSSSGWLPNRFVYRTERLPLSLTQGRSTVTVTLRSLGTIFYYAPPVYDLAQHRMSAPTAGLYQAYTHLGGYLDVSGEKQGAAPQAMPAPAPSPTAEAAWLAAWRAKVDSLVSAKLALAPGALISDDLQFLAEAYAVSGSAAYKNPAVVTQVLAAIDAMATEYAAAPSTYFASSFNFNAGWGGYFGPVGEAIRLLWPDLQGAMAATVAYGGSLGVVTRQTAWSAALRASIDFGRANRKTITNQQMDAAWRTYMANRALLLVDPARALYEAEARRYLYEAAGIDPWSGDDLPGGGPTPVRGTAPFGPNWFTVTSRGTSKEDCLVGSDYGERGGQVFSWALQTGDARLTAQALKLLRARAPLRNPGLDASGHVTSFGAEHVGCRNFQEVDSHVVYLGRGWVEDVLVASRGVSVVGADLVGYVQQQFNEGQLQTTLSTSASDWSGWAGWWDVAHLPEYYAAFRAQPPAGVVLPMTAGQPDFAWFDAENMAVAAKQGEERFWAVLNWRGADSINRLARVYLQSPTTAWLGEVSEDDVQFTPAGQSVVKTGAVEGFPAFVPPDKPVNANIGVSYPAALRPDLTRVPPTNRDAGRGTAYTLRFGHWLVAINAHPTNGYLVPLPSDFAQAVDLVSLRTLAAPVTLSPKNAAVFRLPGLP